MAAFFSKKNSTNFPAHVLLTIGIIDLVRGFLHTFQIQWAAMVFAKLDLSFAKSDQLFLLGIFGISNFLTGTIYILISQKAKNLAPYVLGLIPLAYLTGLMGLRLSGITGQAAFLGRYFMLVYLAVCLATSLFYFIKKFTKN